MHPFEEADFGLAPFRFEGVTRNWFTAYPGDPGKPGGSCDYCGQGIANEFWVRSSDGRRFKVGCDCIEKLAKANNTAFTGDRLLYDAQMAKRRLESDRRSSKAAEKRLAAHEAWALWYTKARKASACAVPHPAIKGLTLAHYIAWMTDHGYTLTAARFPQLTESR